MAEAGFKDIGTYVTGRQNTVAQYIETRPILDLCYWYAWRPGVWVWVLAVVGEGRILLGEDKGQRSGGVGRRGGANRGGGIGK